MGGALIAGLLVSGCSRPTDRAAEDRGSVGNLGSRVCVTNTSSLTATVVFTHADTTNGAGEVPPGGVACGEGTTFWGKDVEGSISQDGGGQANFYASNQWVGAPWFHLVVQDPFRFGTCLGYGWAEGYSADVDSGAFAMHAVRNPDDQWKEFAITLSTSKGYVRGPNQYCDD